MFPWEAVTFKKYSAHDCWVQYWDVVGPSEAAFKEKVISSNKNEHSLYNKIEKLIKSENVKRERDDRRAID